MPFLDPKIKSSFMNEILWILGTILEGKNQKNTVE